MDEFLAGADEKEENAKLLFGKYHDSGDLLFAIQSAVDFSIATVVRTIVFTESYIEMARSAAKTYCEDDAQTLLSFCQNGDVVLLTEIMLAPESTMYCTKPVSAFITAEYKEARNMQLHDFRIVIEKIGGVQLDKLIDNPDMTDSSWFI